jgi:hypothetical protein
LQNKHPTRDFVWSDSDNTMQLKNLFTAIEAEGFAKKFAAEEECLEFLASVKWEDKYQCKKCGHKNYCKGKTPHSRRCTRCKHDESATAHTPFHGCRMPLNLAFQIAYQVCCKPGISSYKLAQINQTRQMTCWKLKKKLIECFEQT